MKPKIVVDENLEPEDDEDVLESSDDEIDLSVTTKSPTPSSLGSPAGPSSPCGSQEPNELQMPKTPVKDGLPIADGTLFSAESPEHSSMVPKRRRIESLKSTETASSANKQNGRSAGCSSSNGSSVPDELAKPMGTPVKVGLPIPKRSPKCGPIVPKRRRIESPSSTETSSSAKPQKGQLQPTGVAPPNESSIPDGFVKPKGTSSEVSIPIPSGSPECKSSPSEISSSTKFPIPAGCIERVGNAVKVGLPIPARSPECGSIVPKRSKIAVELPPVTEAKSQKGQMSFASPNGTPVSAGFENPYMNLQIQLSRFCKAIYETPNPVVASFPGNTSFPPEYAEPAKNPITAVPRTPELIACPAKWKEAQARIAQVSLQMKSHGTKLEEIKSEVAHVLSLIKCSLADNLEKPNGDSVAFEPPIPAGLREGLSQLDTVATIESSVPAAPKQVNGIVNAVESPITIGSSSPTASSDQNGFSMKIRSQTRTEASLPTGSINEAAVASPIQSSVPNGSEQVNESSVPIVTLELVSNKSNGCPAAIGPLISSTTMSFPAGSRKRRAEQVAITSGYAQSDEQPMAIETTMPAGFSTKMAKAKSTNPNKFPTAAGSPFSSVRAFSNAFFGQWKRVQSCLVKFASMLVFLPNDNSATSPFESSLPDEAVSVPLPKPQPSENGPESIDMEIGEDDY
ncbi:hypothetical protein B9Z55_022619 [Caenorhabditis nigoni]|uniref:Uncharacterized protein n=1 Tax=Caenorhabditis nigoni TaxID=1611254 RepID=A0A2G5SL36_9PELO|nr:hypothetical protein B9Z55_022619 [Caenorhabditis nigoni]